MVLAVAQAWLSVLQTIFEANPANALGEEKKPFVTLSCQDFPPLKFGLGPQTWPTFLQKAFWQVQWRQSPSCCSSTWIRTFPALCARSLTCASRRAPTSILRLLVWPSSTCLALFGGCPLWQALCRTHLSLFTPWHKWTRITSPLALSKIELLLSLATGFLAAHTLIDFQTFFPFHHILLRN